MRVLDEYTEDEKIFYESIGLLVAKEITAEKAAEISGYSFNTYLELLKKRDVYPYIYSKHDYEMDLEGMESITSQ